MHGKPSGQCPVTCGTTRWGMSRATFYRCVAGTDSPVAAYARWPGLVGRPVEEFRNNNPSHVFEHRDFSYTV